MIAEVVIKDSDALTIHVIGIVTVVAIIVAILLLVVSDRYDDESAEALAGVIACIIGFFDAVILVMALVFIPW